MIEISKANRRCATQVASISGKEYPAKDGYAITSINVSPDGEYLVANLKCHKCQLWHIGPLLRRILRKDVGMLVSNPYGLAPEGDHSLL